jgi:ankyrin repeat protein
VDARGNTALMRAIGAGLWNIAEVLIQHGADVEISNNDGCTCMSVLHRNKNYRRLRWLFRLTGVIPEDWDEYRKGARAIFFDVALVSHILQSGLLPEDIVRCYFNGRSND